MMSLQNLLYKLSIRYFAGAVYTKRKDDDMPIPLSLLLRGNILLCVAELCTALLRVEVVISRSVLATCFTLTLALVTQHSAHSKDSQILSSSPCTYRSVAHSISSYPTSRGIDQYRIWLRVRRKVLKTAAREVPASGFCRFWASP